jgi:tellurite resistance protein TehA-like permease
MWKSVVEKFPPAYFTLVMATGIISLAAHAQHLDWLAEGFFYLNLGLYPLFLLLLLARALGFWPGVWAELNSHDKGAAFLALVAATCLLGNQVVLLRGNQVVGQALWVLGAACWGLLIYGFLLGVVLRRDKPTLEAGLGGNWLLLAVATEALAVLGANLVPGLGEVAIFGSLCLFLLGSLFYVVITALVVHRLVFAPVKPDEVGAPYWILVGGSAIAVMAGATVLGALPQVPALAEAAGFVKGWSLFFWAASTWWLPFMTLMRIWHHLRAQPAFRYEPANWSMVFPLGMYAAATGKLAEALPLPALKGLSSVFLYVALAAWALTFVGMLVHLFSASPKKTA